jgi:hypothetical protein
LNASDVKGKLAVDGAEKRGRLFVMMEADGSLVIGAFVVVYVVYVRV